MLLEKDNSLVVLVDVQEKLAPYVMNADGMIARCAWVLNLAKALNIPYLVCEQYPKGLGATVPLLAPFKKTAMTLEKVRFSCAKEASFINHLEKSHKKQIIFIGIEAHVCVLQSAIECLEADYDVFVVVDAVSSRHDLDMKYGLKRMKQLGVQLVTAEMLFFEWMREAGTDAFKQLSKDFMK